ncbi:glycerophosphodiester phosphodiesterase family protein [Pacificimonas flava]|uniref:Glycerophosphoryl diester phosphodiesterase n=1 Tax=Pacificimonas flava TaxID=1234595 RepID=M2TLH4_9SPHN|nr:glycerophosphodiester phosphodiesterase family protein [Pacificimonas flava]EMD82531.1 Glycerophosphoryl diester phosphodiesterase [Pacificimonas flava]
MLDFGRAATRKAEERLTHLSARPFAHRGLHGSGGAVENSISAFEAAIEKGLGIELDVQLTLEAGAVVFHDETLERLTGETGPVVGRTMKALSQVPLKNSSDRIWSLQDVLHHIAGRTPLLIEAKVGKNSPIALALAVRRALEGYVGPVGIMSFHPGIPRWFHEHFPSMLNGLVVSEENEETAAKWRRTALARQWSLYHSRAKFLAYDVRSLPSKSAESFRRTGRRVYTWTVREDAHLPPARAHADQLIVEGAAAQTVLSEREAVVGSSAA